MTTMFLRKDVDTDALKRSIGAATCRARKRLGFTQEDAAELLGLSVEYYARIDRGYGIPSVVTLRKIAKCLHVSVDELLGLVPPGSEESSPRSALLRDTLDMQNMRPEIRRLARCLKRSSVASLDVVLQVLEQLPRLPKGHEPGARADRRAKEKARWQKSKRAENTEPGSEAPESEARGNEARGNESPGNESPGNESPGNESPGNESIDLS